MKVIGPNYETMIHQ